MPEKLVDKFEICFIAFNAYPILSQADIPIAGGAERQQVLLADELQKRGFNVSVIVLDHGQASPQVRDGIRIIKSVRSDIFEGEHKSLLSTLYLYTIAPFLFWRSLGRARADIYLQKMVGPSSALGVLFSRLKKKRFIYSVSSDLELETTDIEGKAFPTRFLCQFAIKNADCVIVQNQYQQQLLNTNFNRDGILIKSTHILPRERPNKIAPPIALWVATIREAKQPELFLKLAKEIPEAKFQMVGGSAPEDDPKYFVQIKKLPAQIPNLEFVGFIPHHQIDQYFSRASIFINTSSSEGFPNTFLQAWASYTPVVSLHSDPDGVISRHRLGFYSKSFEQMTKDVKVLLSDTKLRDEMGLNGRRYVEREHDTEKIVSQYIGLFRQLAARGK